MEHGVQTNTAMILCVNSKDTFLFYILSLSRMMKTVRPSQHAQSATF